MCQIYGIEIPPLYLKFDAAAAEGHLPVKSKEIDPNQD